MPTCECRPALNEPITGASRSEAVGVWAMSAIGTKRTWTIALHMSAFGSKADIPRGRLNRVPE
jgi:hypothetical protein